MAWIGDEIKEDIYKELYFKECRYNAGLLNLINLADRPREQRQEIARQGNAASLKTRRVNRAVKRCKRLAYYQQRYFKDSVVIKDESGAELTQKEIKHLIALNNKFDRLELQYNQAAEQIKELYDVDALEETKQRLRFEQEIAREIIKEYGLKL